MKRNVKSTTKVTQPVTKETVAVKAEAVAEKAEKVVTTSVKKAEAVAAKTMEKAAATKETVEKKVEKVVEKAAPAVRKAAAKKETIKETFVLQFAGRDITQAEITKKIKEDWTKSKKQKIKDIKNIEVYMVPEQGAAYYVINGQGGEDYRIEL